MKNHIQQVYGGKPKNIIDSYKWILVCLIFSSLLVVVQYLLMVVHYPQCMKMPHIAWIETLNNKPVETLINYPTRQTIIKWTSGREPAV